MCKPGHQNIKFLWHFNRKMLQVRDRKVLVSVGLKTDWCIFKEQRQAIGLILWNVQTIFVRVHIQINLIW